MFCPKCGTKNPEDGQFCRKCGTDLASVNVALSGGHDHIPHKTKKGKPKYSWESAMGKLFMGVGFLVVACILGITGAAGGHNWWYWMLIPAFSMMGAGVAQVLQITYGNQYNTGSNRSSGQISGASEKALPPKQTEFVESEKERKYQTGELVPPSVVEKTTRLLEIDKENETMTLRKPTE